MAVKNNRNLMILALSFVTCFSCVRPDTRQIDDTHSGEYKNVPILVFRDWRSSKGILQYRLTTPEVFFVWDDGFVVIADGNVNVDRKSATGYWLEDEQLEILISIVDAFGKKNNRSRAVVSPDTSVMEIFIQIPSGLRGSFLWDGQFRKGYSEFESSVVYLREVLGSFHSAALLQSRPDNKKVDRDRIEVISQLQAEKPDWNFRKFWEDF